MKLITVAVLALSTLSAHAKPIPTERASTLVQLLRSQDSWIVGMVAGVAMGDDKICSGSATFATLASVSADDIDGAIRAKPTDDKLLTFAEEGTLIKVILESEYPCK